MTCIKTGCHVELKTRGEWLYGDAFEIKWTSRDGFSHSVFYFRIVARSFIPLSDVVHFTLIGYADWFDEMAKISTLIADNDDVISYGYEGVPI